MAAALSSEPPPPPASATNNPLSIFSGGLEGPGYNFLPPPPLSPQTKALLDKLGVESSTEPVLAKAPTSQIASLLSAAAPALLRAASGIFGLDYQVKWVPRDDAKYAFLATRSSQLEETCLAKIPLLPIILYNVESNADCRLVREACSMLSLTVEMKPVPRGGSVFISEMKQKYQVTTPPCLVDPNTAVTIVDSKHIIDYLFTTYGTGKVPWFLRQREERNPLAWAFVSSSLSVGLARLGAGGLYKYSNPPPRTVDGSPALTLWAYEGSPFCKLVQESLSSLELEHTLIYTPRGSPNRASMWKQVGRFQVPYLQDAYTDLNLFESAAIVEYLEKQYGIAPSPVKFM